MKMVLREIIEAKDEAGGDVYLWLHSSGECLLWPNEKSRKTNDAKNAIEHWQLTEDKIEELIEMGEVDEQGN